MFSSGFLINKKNNLLCNIIHDKGRFFIMYLAKNSLRIIPMKTEKIEERHKNKNDVVRKTKHKPPF